VGGDDTVVDHPVGVDAVERVESGNAESGTLGSISSTCLLEAFTRANALVHSI